jgi:diguanylate cyclase (GGDEF)-like protein
MLGCEWLQYYLFALIALFLVSVFFNLKQRQTIKSTQLHDSALIKKAYFNPITDLPNKQNLEIMMDEQIHRAHRHKKSFVVGVVKILNYHDVLLRSRAIGEEFIIEAATRISESLRDEDVVAHTTENGFVILYNEYLEEDNSKIIFDRITNVFKESFELNAKTILHFKISIGKSVYPTTATTSETLINAATREALKT